VTGGWRKFHDDELQSSYSSLCIAGVIMLRRIQWMRHVACMREMRNMYEMLVRKSE
jgi:hypothetical protein